MSTPYDKDKAGGNSSFGNKERPADIQGDEPGKQAEPHDPAKPASDGAKPSNKAPPLGHRSQDQDG